MPYVLCTHPPLPAAQLLQLSGRAGRRGLDTLGHVVLCHSNYEDVRQAYSMLLRPADAISSHFCVSYNTALRLLATRPVEECRQFVSRSFGAFQRTTSRDTSEARLTAVTLTLTLTLTPTHSLTLTLTLTLTLP